MSEAPASARVIEVAEDESTPATGGSGRSSVPGGQAKSRADGGSQNRLKPPPRSASSASAASPGKSDSVKASPKTIASGIGEEVLNTVANQKFENQEEKLKDVARHAIALLRDYPKIKADDCMRKVDEIRKSLIKYEMQYVRVWELQEKTRHAEVEALKAETQRCQMEAEQEGEKIIGLRQTHEKEKKRRKRFAIYEESATEINQKKTRLDSEAEIKAAKADIEWIRQQRAELETLIDVRNQRAQLLLHAVAELKTDLQKETKKSGEILGTDVGSKGSGKAPSESAGALGMPVEIIS